MFNCATVRETLGDAAHYGYSGVQHTQLNYDVIREKRIAYVKRLNVIVLQPHLNSQGIYKNNLDRENIEHHFGAASFVNENTIKVGEKFFTAPHIIIATGGKPSLPTSTPGYGPFLTFISQC